MEQALFDAGLTTELAAEIDECVAIRMNRRSGCGHVRSAAQERILIPAPSFGRQPKRSENAFLFETGNRQGDRAGGPSGFRQNNHSGETCDREGL